MSDTMVEYLTEYGNVSFAEAGMNDVDSLVLCQLSYLKFDGMVPLVTENRPFVSMRQIYEHPDYEKLYADERFAKDNRALFENALHSRRFGKMRMNCYVNIIITQEDFQTQFSAITFLMDDGTLYIAYRGTDETLIGWKEDLNMAFIHPVPGQAYSVKYLNIVAGKIRSCFYVGGHSKGGNFAVYAAMKCKPHVQERIIKVYCMDGPGFRPEVMEECHYERIADRTCRILPHSSLVGMLFYNDEAYRVIRSKSFGLMQHNPFSWLTKEDHFIETDKIYHTSKLMDDTVNQWVYSLDQEHLHKVIDTLFSVAGATNTDNLLDIDADKKGAWNAMHGALKELDEEDREMMKKVFQALFDLAKENMKKDFQDTFKKFFGGKHE